MADGGDCGVRARLVSELGRVQDLVRRLELQLHAPSSDAASVDLCSRLVHELVALTDRSIGMARSPDLAAHFHLPAATASPLSDPLLPRPAAGVEVPAEELAPWIPGGEVVRQGTLREDVLPRRRRAWTWPASYQRRLALLLEVSSAASSSSSRSPVWIRSTAPASMEHFSSAFSLPLPTKHQQQWWRSSRGGAPHGRGGATRMEEEKQQADGRRASSPTWREVVGTARQQQDAMGPRGALSIPLDLKEAGGRRFFPARLQDAAAGQKNAIRLLCRCGWS